MQEQERILTIFIRLQSGEKLSKKELAQEFGVSDKTIQRDLSLLKHFILSTRLVAGEIVYDTKARKHYLLGASQFNKKEILVISKILLENRAFNKGENDKLLNGLLALLPEIDRKEVQQIILSEMMNYAPLHDKQDRIEKIWEISEYIRKEQMMCFDYMSPQRKTGKQHNALPIALYYDNHYFYLIGYDMAYNKYIDYRLDRIVSWERSTMAKPPISYGQKVRDGDLRKYKVDAFTGVNVTFRVFYTQDPAILYDQFPVCRKVSETDQGCEFEITSQNTLGLKRYLISQLDALTVLSPSTLVNEIKETLQKMSQQYQS